MSGEAHSEIWQPLRQLRSSEWLAIAFFCYIAALSPFFRDRPHLHWQPMLLACLVIALYLLLAAAERRGPRLLVSRVRDWVPIFVTLLAFQEMDLFQPLRFPHYWEPGWIAQDKWLLGASPLQPVLNSFGPALPFYLETCYLLVYGVAPVCVAVLYLSLRRKQVDRFYLFYLSATLGAYAFFPFFPTEPPRFLYPDAAMPSIVTAMRMLNLSLLRAATIHVSVFPSAHVSSAFSCAWAMLRLLPEKPVVGWILLVYAVSVAVATVYGRYHYTADAVAGFLVSCAAFALCCWYLKAMAAHEASQTRVRTG